MIVKKSAAASTLRVPCLGPVLVVHESQNNSTFKSSTECERSGDLVSLDSVDFEETVLHYRKPSEIVFQRYSIITELISEYFPSPAISYLDVRGHRLALARWFAQDR